MAVKVTYSSIGHGRRPSGTYDSGTTNGSLQEHKLAEQVVRYVSVALSRSKLPHVAEQCPDPRTEQDHAPNWSGSSNREKLGDYDCCVEVHFDWKRAPRGGFGIWRSKSGNRLASLIRARYKDAALPTRSNYRRTDLGWLNNTRSVAVLWESDRIQDHSSSHLKEIGEAIAAGICDYLDVTYRPPTTTEETMAKLDQDDYHNIAQEVAKVLPREVWHWETEDQATGERKNMVTLVQRSAHAADWVMAKMRGERNKP